jgi:hypothetical protein
MKMGELIHIFRIAFGGRDLFFTAFNSWVSVSSNTGGIVAPTGPLIRLLSVMARVDCVGLIWLRISMTSNGQEPQEFEGSAPIKKRRKQPRMTFNTPTKTQIVFWESGVRVTVENRCAFARKRSNFRLDLTKC